MVEEILDNDVLLAIIIRSGFKKDGIQFFTPSHFSQQLGYMNRSKGYKIDAHSHRLVERKVSVTGSFRIELFDSKQQFVKEAVLQTGDTILLASGGHAIEMLEDTELIEVKQGPYTSDDDKVKFSSNPQ